MATSLPNLRLLDHSAAARELDLASELFHRINRIIPPDQRLLNVSPDCRVRDAVTLMQQHGYSQVPVVASGEVLGVFSFRSFARGAARATLEEWKRQGCAPGDLTVDEFIERFEFARLKEEISRVFDAMEHDNGVLIGTPERLVGILTPMDFVRYLYEVASPFVLVSEIELALRALIRVALSAEQIAAAATRCLSSVYGEGKVPLSLEGMTFDNYQCLISHGENWREFEPVLGGTRTRTSGKLKEIGAIRNDLFHFRREITMQDHEILTAHRNWLLTKVKEAGGGSTPEQGSVAVSSTGKEPKNSSMKLLPHQNALVDTFFDPASKRVILLCGEAGLGKSSVLVALATRLLEERPTTRALFLVPAAARSQFAEMFRIGGTRTLFVDRYQFREMLDSTTGGELWPRGVVTVLSRDFAKQPDIRASLIDITWDVVVADEAHSFGGRAEETLLRVGASAKRVILASATLSGVELSEAFPAADITVVEWHRDQVVGHHGAPLEALRRPSPHEVSFSLSPAELSLIGTVGDLRRVFETGAPPQSFMADLLLRFVRSSPARLERALQGLVARLAVRDGTDSSLDASEQEVPEENTAWWIDRQTAEKATGIAARALQEIEAIGSDSKLSAFVGLLSHLNEVKVQCSRICVLTEFRDTVYYLAAELEDRNIEYHLLHGSMGDDDRRRSLNLFSSTGGILVTTVGGIGGVGLGDVTDLVLYDVPSARATVQGVSLWFNPLDRQNPLNVHVLVPSNSPNGRFSEPLELLREVLGLPTTARPPH